MANIEYENLVRDLVGTKIPKPISGTLSGHAAGEPFDKYVYHILKEKHPQKVFRQYEYLNFLYTKNPDTIGVEERKKLVDSPTLLFLLSRGKAATQQWATNNPFEEKQNDTADILFVDKRFYEIIDIKTRNISKSSQPPNIISAYKLAQTCAKMIDNSEYDSFEISYLGIDWILENDFLVCKDSHHCKLFKAQPSSLYINWAAAMQLQFHVDKLNQNFEGSREEWARAYLLHFTIDAKKRARAMIDKFVKPFEKYIQG